MNKNEQFQLIDKFIKQSLSEKEIQRLHLLRQDPDFENTFLLMSELRSALRNVKISEKMAYLKHLELSLYSKAGEKPSISASLKKLISKINNRHQLFLMVLGLKLHILLPHKRVLNFLHLQ